MSVWEHFSPIEHCMNICNHFDRARFVLPPSAVGPSTHHPGGRPTSSTSGQVIMPNAA
jgi:hypothetical protein